jgi:hypothetical protein
MADEKGVVEFHIFGSGDGGGGGDEGFEVDAIADCPHVHGVNTPTRIKALEGLACAECGSETEPWICLGCGAVGCSRYVNGHAAEHASSGPGCSIALSPADMSLWCFACDAYLDVFRLPEVHEAFTHLYRLKFGCEPELPKAEVASATAAAPPVSAASAEPTAAVPPAPAAAGDSGASAAAASVAEAAPSDASGRSLPSG